MTEIERKYLVKNNSYKMQAQRAGLIVQGYLGDNPLSETRIAIRENKGWLFIKAKGTLSRFEWQQEIDEFLGDNEGLTIAECELTQATLNPELPDFVGDEVTEDTRYYNYNLASNPYLNWDDDSE